MGGFNMGRIPGTVVRRAQISSILTPWVEKGSICNFCKSFQSNPFIPKYGSFDNHAVTWKWLPKLKIGSSTLVHQKLACRSWIWLHILFLVRYIFVTFYFCYIIVTYHCLSGDFVTLSVSCYIISKSGVTYRLMLHYRALLPYRAKHAPHPLGWTTINQGFPA